MGAPRGVERAKRGRLRPAAPAPAEAGTSGQREPGSWGFICPICREELIPGSHARRCGRCGRTYHRSAEIWRFLPDERLAQHERFLREYRVVREDQGWGRQDPAYFLALPRVAPDDPQRNVWRRRSESYRMLLMKVIDPMAAKLGRPLRILDLGAGNCWLAYRLAEMGHQVAAVDLSDSVTDGLGAHAWYRPDDSGFWPGRVGTALRDPEGAETLSGCPPFTPIQADFDRLPLPDQGADVALFNAALHYSPDCAVTLREGLRVLATGGTLVIMDSPVYRQVGSGEQMVREREEAFQRTYGFRSNSVPAENFLTTARLEQLARDLGLRWQMYAPGGRLGSHLRLGVMGHWRRLRGLRELAEMPIIVGHRVHGTTPDTRRPEAGRARHSGHRGA